MKRHALFLLAFASLVFGAGVLTAGGEDDAIKKDRKQMAGTWRVISYEKDGKNYILMSTFRGFGQKNDPVRPSPYWTVKIDQTILGETEKINQKALTRTAGKGKSSESTTDRAVPVPAYDGVMHMDRLDAARAVVIRMDAKEAIDLAVLPLP